jgi:hypothetical protein
MCKTAPQGDRVLCHTLRHLSLALRDSLARYQLGEDMNVVLHCHEVDKQAVATAHGTRLLFAHHLDEQICRFFF